MPEFAGDMAAPAGRFAVVAARFNALVVDRLLAGALETFARHGVGPDRVDVFKVPGALEIPLVARRAAASGKYAAVACLGAVVRGDTAHFDVVVNQSAAGLATAALETGVPVVNAILTTDTVEQALDRAGAKHGNKGADAALAALEMASLLRQMPPEAGGRP